MKTSDFFLGYFYALFKIFTQTSDKVSIGIENNVARMNFLTPLGKIQFAINRGISHVDGNYVLPAFINYHNMFDTVTLWNSHKVNDVILNYFSGNYDRVYDGEIRLDLKEMIEIIDLCGGILWSETIEHNISLFNTSFEDPNLKP